MKAKTPSRETRGRQEESGKPSFSPTVDSVKTRELSCAAMQIALSRFQSEARRHFPETEDPAAVAAAMRQIRRLELYYVRKWLEVRS